MTDPTLLEIDALRVVTERDGQVTPIVRGVSMSIDAGETVCVVGETGSGKSMTMLAAMGLLPTPPIRVDGGEVRLAGRNLLALDEREFRSVRGREMAMVYQEPLTSLNPLMRIGDQIVEALRAHGVGRKAAMARCVEVLQAVGIPDPAHRVHVYPHELSGGMRQRVMIGMALALRPRMLIADEPTTALDATIQQQIIALVHETQQETGMAVAWITHDLGVVARLADRVVVMYAGEVVEHGTTDQIFAAPRHPYTQGLLASLPRGRGSERGRLRQIPGSAPDLRQLGMGCAFAPRCAHAIDRCAGGSPGPGERSDAAVACWVVPEWQEA